MVLIFNRNDYVILLFPITVRRDTTTTRARHRSGAVRRTPSREIAETNSADRRPRAPQTFMTYKRRQYTRRRDILLLLNRTLRIEF